jgi:histidinol-phosphate aminotransferase
MHVLFGNGSDELISILIQACCAPGECVLAPEPTFVMYRGSAQWCHAKFVGVDLNADFSLNLPAMLEAIQTYQPKLVFLAYPNNPTGNSFDRAAMEAVVEAAPGLVVVDEAYEPFGQDTWMQSMSRYPNVVVLRTLSKLGLAGIRLGYAAGPKEWIQHIDKVRPPYNINVLTRIAAEFVLEHADVIKRQTNILRQQRESLASQLSMFENVKVFASDANFLLIRCPNASNVFDSLKKRGILVKNLSHAHLLLSDCLRITVSALEENEMLMAALQEVLAE